MVQQSALPGVGVPHQGGGRSPGSDSGTATGLVVLAEASEIFFQDRDASPDATAVTFQSGFSRSTGSDAARLLGQRSTLSPQTWQPIAEQRQFHLQRTFPRGGVLGEYVQDYRLPINHVAFEQGLQIALLGGGERVVENHYVDVLTLGEVRQVGSLTLTDQQSGIGCGPAKHSLVRRQRSGGVGEKGQFFQGLFQLHGGVSAELDPHQEGFLPGDLEVLHGGGEPTALPSQMLIGHLDAPRAVALEILALVEWLVGFFLSDYLRLSDRHHRLSGRRPQKTPGAGRDCPEVPSGDHVDQCKSVVLAVAAR